MKNIQKKLNNFGHKVSDFIADFGGSWTYIFCFLGFSALYMLYNTFVPNTFDPLPFPTLNLILGFVASLQAPIMLMSGNRQSLKDRKQALLDLNTDHDTNTKVAKLEEDVKEIKKILKDKKPSLKK